MPFFFMKKKKRYNIKANEAQLEILQNALNLYFRVGMGQFNTILEHPDYFLKNNPTVDHHLNELQKCLTGLPHSGSHGIHSPKIHESNRIACEIHDVIRHHLSWEKNPEGGTSVVFNPPRKVSNEELITISEVKNKHVKKIEELLNLKNQRKRARS